jgi:hypothetical protein
VNAHFKINFIDSYYAQIWETFFGKELALRISIEELWSNFKREFLKGIPKFESYPSLTPKIPRS